MLGAVPLADLEAIKVDVRNAAQVDGARRCAVGFHALGKRRDAAGAAEMVLKLVRIEGVGPKVRLGGLECKGRCADKGQQAAAPPAQRTVAIDGRFEIPLDLKGDLAAMAASLMQHGSLPDLPRQAAAWAWVDRHVMVQI